MTWDDLTFIKYKQCIQPSSCNHLSSYFLASRWFFQSLRLMKAAEPSGKRPIDIPKGGACSTKWSQENRALWRRERSKETFFTTTRPSLPKEGTFPSPNLSPHGERLNLKCSETKHFSTFWYRGTRDYISH